MYFKLTNGYPLVQSNMSLTLEKLPTKGPLLPTKVQLLKLNWTTLSILAWADQLVQPEKRRGFSLQSLNRNIIEFVEIFQNFQQKGHFFSLFGLDKNEDPSWALRYITAQLDSTMAHMSPFNENWSFFPLWTQRNTVLFHFIFFDKFLFLFLCKNKLKIVVPKKGLLDSSSKLKTLYYCVYL